MERCDVVIPAGGVIDEEYARKIGTPIRALAPLGTAATPVMQRVVDALRGCGRVRKIIGVGDGTVAASVIGVDSWLPAGPSGPLNILRGLAALEDAQAPALVCTSDLPLVTSDAVRLFIDGCRADADIAVGTVGAKAYDAVFAGAPVSEWVHLRDAGPCTLCGLFQVRPVLLQRHEAMLSRVFSARKSQLKMARLLGPHLLWLWATRALTLRALVQRGEAILDCRVQVQRDVPPELAFDIDTTEDYVYADTRIRNQESGRPAHRL